MTLIQDVRFALRQLRKTPGFTLTAILTLALGIGANAAIFTLVNAVLMKNLPVTDPKTLVRLGDKNDCCVGMGVRENEDYAIFSTATWQYVKKNTPEFEELAAIQAGFEPRPITARRGGSQDAATVDGGRVCFRQLLPHVRSAAAGGTAFYRCGRRCRARRW